MRERDVVVVLLDCYPTSGVLLYEGLLAEVVLRTNEMACIRPLDGQCKYFVAVEDVRVLSPLELLARQAQ